MKRPNAKASLATAVALMLITGSATLSIGATTKATTSTTKTAQTSPAPNNNGVRGNGFRGGYQFNLKPVLDKLVKAKTITAAQETKIIAYQNKKDAARKAEMAKMQKMTDAQRKAYFEKQRTSNTKPAQRQSQFADLVKNKTITQKQSDAIEKAIAASRPTRRNFQGQNKSGGNN